MGSTLRRLSGNERGNVAVVFALALPALLGAVGAAVEYARWTGQQEQLQGAADAAALAVAKDFQVAAPDPGRVQSVAESIVRTHLTGAQAKSPSFSVSSSILPSRNGVRIVVRQARDTMLSAMISDGVDAAEVGATAKLVGSRRMCIRAYDTTGKEAVFTDGKSKILAPTCDVNSASTSVESVLVKGTSVVEAAVVCSANGIVKEGGARITGGQVTKCPVPPDPLADRVEPPVGKCTYTSMFEPKEGGAFPKKESSTATNRFPIKPGVYCKGLKVPGDWFVKFEPGIYVIKGDKFEINGKADVLGDNVLFHLADEKAIIDWKGDSRIALSGRTTGDQAGLLFFESRSNAAGKVHHFKSEGAERVVGTVYLPQSVFEMDFKARFANQSAFTVLLVKKLIVKGESEIALNTNYHLTDVPVADAISGKGQGARLAE